MTYTYDKIPLGCRTSETFDMNIDDVGYEIGARTPAMFIDKNDVSEYLTITGISSMAISIPASVINGIGVGVHDYEVALRIDSDNSDTLFAGNFTIVKGLP